VVTVRIPTVLRSLTGGAATVTAGGNTVAEVLRQVATAHPGLAERLFDGSGGIRPFVNVFVDDEDIRFAQGLGTEVADGHTVSILPAIAGG
jgi:sulfur-carrier protein